MGGQKLPWAIATGALSWELQPFVKGKKRFVDCNCTVCGRIFKEGWSINGRNLKSNETRIPIHYHAEPLDTNPEQHPIGGGESQSKDIVNLKEVDDERKRKRFEARIEQLPSTTSETEHIDNSNLQKRTGSEVLSVNHTQRQEEKSEAESLGATHILPDSRDANLGDAETLESRHQAESSDAETLKSRRGLKLKELGYIGSTLKEVPKLDGDQGSSSDSSEDEEND